MRRSIRPLLLLTALPLLALGCPGPDDDDENPWCYSTDESGAVKDSVRPDTGYVCVASPQPASAGAAAASTVAGTDSVRTDTMRIQLRAVRRDSLP